jgi:GMP synthase (glutamine-hydrolysing)
MRFMSTTALILQHSPEVRGGLFEEILNEQGWKLEILPLFLGSPLPLSTKDFGMILVLGGPMSANDEKGFHFLKKEIPFIRQALKLGHPVLGIGLGAQLMAKALGATVCQGPFKEIGWYWINQTPLARSDPLFSNLDPYLLVFEWHRDTFELPSEAIGLAGNRAYPNQAFRIESLSYGLQFHLEVTETIIKTWLSSWVREIKIGAKPQSLTPEDILLDARIYLERLHAQARAFFLGYLKLLEKMNGKNNHATMPRSNITNRVKKADRQGGCYV